MTLASIRRVGDATISYLDDKFNPVAPARATLAKIVYDDGRVVFAYPKRPKLLHRPPLVTK